MSWPFVKIQTLHRCQKQLSDSKEYAATLDRRLVAANERIKELEQVNDAIKDLVRRSTTRIWQTDRARSYYQISVRFSSQEITYMSHDRKALGYFAHHIGRNVAHEIESSRFVREADEALHELKPFSPFSEEPLR